MNKEILEPPFIIEQSKGANMGRQTRQYSICISMALLTFYMVNSTFYIVNLNFYVVNSTFFYGQLDFLCGQLYTFYAVNSTFYMVNYTLFIWSTRLFMWSTIHLLYGQRDLFTAKYKLFIRPGNALRDQTQTKLRKLSSQRTLFEAFELLKKHESKHSKRKK